MLNKNIETFLGCDADYTEATIVLFGAPFDGTTSYRPGARFAPRAIRGESYGLETYSPYQDKDMCDLSVFDSGDLELCFGNTERVLTEIEVRTKTILDDGKLPIMMGGEHLVTLGAVRAFAERFSDLHIIHFDAHADLRDDYLEVKLSHATVIRRCHDILGDGRIFQFGIRSGDRSEFLWSREGHVNTCKFDFSDLKNVLKNYADQPCYLTIDLDVLDPSAFPGTGTPEAGGVSFDELLTAIRQVTSGLNIVGCDICELSPQLDSSGASTATACKILRELLLALS